MKIRSALVVLGLFVLCATIGCNNGGIKRCQVQGTITIDGKPVEQGSITLHAMPGTDSPTAGATIANGKFEFDKKKGPTAGKFQAEIVAIVATGNKVMAPGGLEIDETIDLMPANMKYPTGSDVPEIELKSGKNQLDLSYSSGENAEAGAATESAE